MEKLESRSIDAPMTLCPHCGILSYLQDYADDVVEEGEEEAVEIECKHCKKGFLADIESRFTVSFYTKTYKIKNEVENE